MRKLEIERDLMFPFIPEVRIPERMVSFHCLLCLPLTPYSLQSEFHHNLIPK